MMLCVGYGGRDDYDRGYGSRSYDRDYDDRDRYMSRRGWDDGTPATPRHILLHYHCLLFSSLSVSLLVMRRE